MNPRGILPSRFDVEPAQPLGPPRRGQAMAVGGVAGPMHSVYAPVMQHNGESWLPRFLAEAAFTAADPDEIDDQPGPLGTATKVWADDVLIYARVPNGCYDDPNRHCRVFVRSDKIVGWVTRGSLGDRDASFGSHPSLPNGSDHLWVSHGL